MARIFTDGAEMGDSLFWTVTSGLDVSTTQKRSGSYSYRNSSTTASKTFSSAYSEVYFRFGLYIGEAFSVYLRSDSTNIGRIEWSAASHKLSIYIGSTLTATGDIELSASTWYLIEWHLKIADSEGISELKVDGISDTTTGSVDTKPGAETTINNVLFTSQGYSYYDDFALNDTTGGSDDSWCGEGKVIFLTPNTNGDNSEFVNSSGTSTNNYLFVDDIPSDSDISYVQASSSGTLDLYNLSACGLSSVTINRVWAEARAKDTVAEGGQIFLTIKTEATEYDSSAISLLTSYTKCVGTDHTVNPQTTTAWTTTQLDALQVGPKVI